jgi:hypothetical protein
MALYSELDHTLRSYPADPSELPKRAPKGVYDPELWCDKCEKASSVLDAKVIPVLKDYVPHLHRVTGVAKATHNTKYEILELTGVTPLDLYLFALSVMWRASASRRDEVRTFTLGPVEKEVRKILNSGTWPDQSTRQFQTLVAVERDPNLIGPVSLPARYIFSGGNVVQFVGAGVEFKINTDKKPWLEGVGSFALQSNRPLYVIRHSYKDNGMVQYLMGIVDKADRKQQRR